jgi:cytochrome b561
MNTSTQAFSLPDRYDSRTIALHWISAFLVLGLWVLGQCIDFFPRGVPRVTARSLHISFGVLLGAVLIVRVAWRFKGGVKLAPADGGLFGRLAGGAHHVLYALLAAIVVLGLACVWIRGDTLFNLITVPAFDLSNRQLRRDAVELHELAANALLAVAALHAAAALWHHRVLKDGVLRRMWPRLR